MSTRTDEAVLSIDIGGTKTAVAVVGTDGSIHASDRFPTEVGRGPQDLCDRAAQQLEQLAAETDAVKILGAGISAPGPLSSAQGTFLNPPNMPGWHGFAVANALQQRLGVPVELMNDANAAAFAEHTWGAGRKAATMVFFTMSTGMGAGLVIGGRLHEGADDMAGEVGHIRLSTDGPVGFGVRGSLEGFCSGPGIAQLAVMKLTQALHAQQPSRLFEARDDWRLIDSSDVGRAAEAGDELALDCLRECGAKLGLFCATVVDLLNPDAIVLGTIGRIHGETIIPVAREVVQRTAHRPAAERVQFLPAALGEDLPYLAGAAAWLSRNGRSNAPA